MGFDNLTPEDFALAKVIAKSGDWENFIHMIDEYLKNLETRKSALFSKINVENYFNAGEKLINGSYQSINYVEYENLMYAIYASEETAFNLGFSKQALLLREIFNENKQMKYLVERYGIL
jgi:hypothetical protein